MIKSAAAHFFHDQEDRARSYPKPFEVTEPLTKGIGEGAILGHGHHAGRLSATWVGCNYPHQAVRRATEVRLAGCFDLASVTP